MQKGTIERPPKILQRVTGTQEPFNGKLMGMFGVGGQMKREEEEGLGGRDNVSWGIGGKCAGLGGVTKKAGQGGGACIQGGSGFRGEVGRISITPRRRRSRDLR